MQQGNDFGSQSFIQGNLFPPTHPIPNPISNPNEYVPSNPIQPSYASAPPYSQYPTSEYPIYSSSSSFAGVHSTFSPNLDPMQSMPPSAPSYAQTQSQSQAPPSQFPSYPPYSSSPLQAEQSSVPLSAPYQLPQPSSAPYYHYDSHRSNPDLGHTPNLNPPFSSAYVSSETPYDGAGYYNEHSGKYGLSNAGSYAQTQPSYDHDYYEKSLERGFQSMNIGAQDDGLGDGVYAYDGGRAEPYGARGTIPRSSSSSPWGGFDDYGRSVGISSGRNDQAGGAGKIARAVPKAETQQDVKNGVQKFRVKLLPEGASVNTMDVLCQIGLDGIRMVDPSSNMTLRVYPLESVTRWEVLDSSIFCFWSKTSIDVEPKRIRLKSNSYTTNTILDTVTAATVQFKEMGGSDVSQGSRGSAEGSKLSEKSNEKKKGFGDWMNLMKPDNLEKDHWVPDEAVSQCTSCGVAFGPFVRRHHCRNCGDIFCDKCSQGRTALSADESAQLVRVCDGCMAEVTQRLSNAKEANRSVAVKSHEDLARKLQEEMERTRKSSSGSKSSDSSSGRKTREVACPICTVHLQVQIPNSGSETIECGVCQHPFLVSAH